MAIKRGKGQRLIPLEELRADQSTDMEPADTAHRRADLRTALGIDSVGTRPHAATE